MGTEMPQDPNHIWLRQSVTFTVNGETRTIELALPLRPGATPGEVEALLDEADAGMRRLSRRLDAHLATLRQRADALEIPETPETPETPEAPAASAPPIPAEAHVPAARVSAPDLTIPTFLAEITTMGYTQRQAMERLNVRSLTGLNLRESLESLRRQALLGDHNGAAPAPAGPPLAFDEEDGEDTLASEPEMELSFPDPASQPDEDDEDVATPPAPAPTLDALRRDARLTPAAKLPAPQRRASPPGEASAVERVATPAPEAEEAPAARAARILGELRGLRGGGAVNNHQRAALANIVTSELTAKGVEALVKDVWNITPDELGPEQVDALISWGKRDHFKDEAREVIRAARAAGPPLPPPVESAEPVDETEAPEAPEASEAPTPSARGGRGGGRARSSGPGGPGGPGDRAGQPRGEP